MKVSCEVVFDIVLAVLDKVVLLLGPFLLLGGWGLVLYVAFVFFTFSFFSFEHDPFILVVLCNSLGMWLLLNVLFNWVFGFLTSPGVAPSTAVGKETEEEARKCHKCKDRFKPVRSHHCHVCGKCILGELVTFLRRF